MGTQSTLEDLLEVELKPEAKNRGDVGEIVNYVAAMTTGWPGWRSSRSRCA
jgi:hypothetical protein